MQKHKTLTGLTPKDVIIKYFTVSLTFTVGSENDEPTHSEIVEELQNRMSDDHIDCSIKVEDISEDFDNE